MALKIFLQNIFDFTLKDPKAPERSGGAFGEWGFGVLGMGQHRPANWIAEWN